VNARTGQIEHDVGVPSGVVSLSFPSTNDLLVGGFDGVLRQVDPRTGSALAHPVLVESGPTFSLAADSANGRFVVTGLLGQASLWNIDSLDQFGTPLPGATGNMGAAAFTQRGHELVVVNDDGTGVLWPMTVSAWEAHACAVARRNLTQEEWRRFAPGQPYRRTCPQYPAGR
jgi:hypothetical protein